jgi:hypothetical protein
MNNLSAMARSKKVLEDSEEEEYETPVVKKGSKKAIAESESDEDAPVVKKSSKKPVVADDSDEDASSVKKSSKKAVVADDSDEDAPPVKKSSKKAGKKADDSDEDASVSKKSSKKAGKKADDSDNSDEDAPDAKKSSKKADVDDSDEDAPVVKKSSKKTVVADESDEDAPVVKKSSKKSGKKADDSDDDNLKPAEKSIKKGSSKKAAKKTDTDSGDETSKKPDKSAKTKTSKATTKTTVTEVVPIPLSNIKASNLTFDKAKPGGMATNFWINYFSGDGKKPSALYTQTPWIKLVSGGIPDIDPKFVTDQTKRAHLNVSLDDTQPSIKAIRKCLQAIDTFMDSDETRIAIFGKKNARLRPYSPCIKLPKAVRDATNDNEEKAARYTDKGNYRYDHLKFNLPIKRDKNVKQDEVDPNDVELDLDIDIVTGSKKDGTYKVEPVKITTLDEASELMSFLSTVRIFFQFQRVWILDTQYGIAMKAIHIQVRPSEITSSKKKAVIDSDDDGSEVASHVHDSKGSKKSKDFDSDDESSKSTKKTKKSTSDDSEEDAPTKKKSKSKSASR